MKPHGFMFYKHQYTLIISVTLFEDKIYEATKNVGNTFLFSIASNITKLKIKSTKYILSITEKY